MIAFVRGETAASTAAGSMHSVSGRTSTRTGRAPTCSTTFAVAAKVSVGTITSSPGPTPSATSATWRPAVQEVSISEVPPGAPTYSPKARSNSLVRGPVVIQSDRRAATTSSISSGPIDGGENGRKVSRGMALLYRLSSALRAEGPRPSMRKSRSPGKGAETIGAVHTAERRHGPQAARRRARAGGRRHHGSRGVGAQRGQQRPARGRPERARRQRQRQPGHERRRRELPEVRDRAVLTVDVYLPIPVLEVLTPQLPVGAADVVAGADAVREPDQAPGLDQAVVELVVLVARQLLVEQPDAD